jgi:tetratricopeptide (TPR) repeat protein
MKLVVVLFASGPAAIRAGPIGLRTEQEQLRLPEGIPEIEQAVVHFRRRDYDQSLALLRTAIERHPELFPARLLFAKLCLLNEQPALGRAALEQAAVEKPDLPETYLVFGRLALREGRLTDAQLQLDKAAALADSGSWSEPLRTTFRLDAREGLAAVAERRKDWPAAAAALAAVLALDPSNGRARQRLAAALFRQGRHEQAHAELLQAVKDDATLEPAALVMGRLFAEEGDAAKAAEWMEGAVRSAPDDVRARRAFASWLLGQDRAERAKVQAEAAARLDPNSSETRLVRGLIAWYLKDYGTAEQIFQALHLESPADLTASNYWALALAEQSDPAKRQRAFQVAQVNARLHPNSAEALTTLGRASFQVGRFDEAEQELRAAMSSGTTSPEAAYYFARVLSARGRPDAEVVRWLKAGLDAPGRFAFRAEAQQWLDELRARGTARPEDKPK